MQKFLLLLVILLAGMLAGNPSFCQYKKDKKLTKKLKNQLQNFKGVAGVYVLNLKNGKEAFVNADTLFPTASIIKVPILVGIFKKIVDGKLSYHEPLIYRDSMSRGGSGIMQYFKDSTKIDLSIPITLMISHSDNTAAVWCEQMAGGGATINTWLDKHGYKYTRVNSRTKGREKDYEKYGWGQTTPREMAHLLVSIREKEILTPAACERMYRDMTNIYWDDFALSQVPPFVQTASKQGMVNASRSELVMVNAPRGDYVFYVATKNNEDQRWKPDNAAWQLARDVSKLLWNYYEPDSDWKPPTGYSEFWDWE